VDVVELQGVGDQVVDVDLPLHVPVDDPRHVGAAPGAAEGGALPHPPGHQLKRPGADLLPRGGDADDDADPPAAVTAFQCLPHRLHIADALEAVIGAALGQIDEVGHQVALYLLRVDEMGHAEFLGELPAPWVEVDPDDYVGPGHPAALHDVEPDAAQSEHDHP